MPRSHLTRCKRSRYCPCDRCAEKYNVENKVITYSDTFNDDCVAGNEKAVKRVFNKIGRDFDITECNFLDPFTIHLVALGGKLGMVKLLVSRGVPINYSDHLRAVQYPVFTPKYDHGLILALLIQRGSKFERGLKTIWMSYVLNSLLGKSKPCLVTQKRPSGSTPLSYAADRGNIEVVRFLLDQVISSKVNCILTRTFYKEPREETFNVFDYSKDTFARSLIDTFSTMLQKEELHQ